jgi:hypothetical protein
MGTERRSACPEGICRDLASRRRAGRALRRTGQPPCCSRSSKTVFTLDERGWGGRQTSPEPESPMVRAAAANAARDDYVAAACRLISSPNLVAVSKHIRPEPTTTTASTVLIDLFVDRTSRERIQTENQNARPRPKRGLMKLRLGREETRHASGGGGGAEEIGVSMFTVPSPPQRLTYESPALAPTGIPGTNPPAFPRARWFFRSAYARTSSGLRPQVSRGNVDVVTVRRCAHDDGIRRGVR